MKSPFFYSYNEDYGGWFSQKSIVCVKGEDKPTHHPLLTLDWDYPPAYWKGNCQSTIY